MVNFFLPIVAFICRVQVTERHKLIVCGVTWCFLHYEKLHHGVTILGNRLLYPSACSAILRIGIASVLKNLFQGKYCPDFNSTGLRQPVPPCGSIWNALWSFSVGIQLVNSCTPCQQALCAQRCRSVRKLSVPCLQQTERLVSYPGKQTLSS